MPAVYTLGKKNRLYLKKEVSELFTNGNSFISYPLRVVYLFTKDQSNNNRDKLLVSVGKKYHKRANKRNRIKRLLRESYRIARHDTLISFLKDYEHSLYIALMCVTNEVPTYKTIDSAVRKAINKIVEKHKSDELH